MKKRIYATGLSDAVGLGMYLSLSVLFFHKAVDLPNAEIGLVLGVAGVTSLLGAMPIARAAERFGTRTVLTVLFLVRAAASSRWPRPPPSSPPCSPRRSPGC